MNNVKLIRVFLVFSSLFFLSEENFACSCIGKRNVKSELKKSAVVFSGIVMHIESVFIPDSTLVNDLKASGANTDSISPNFLGDYMRMITLKVETKFKGSFKTDSISILTGFGSGDCGFPFELNKSYIVYANKRKYAFGKSRPQIKNFYWTDICTRSQELNQEEMQILISIRKPKKIRC